MRGVLLGAVLLAGCSGAVPSTGPEGEAKVRGGSTTDPPATERADIQDVLNYYDSGGVPFRRHPKEGQRILFRVRYFTFGGADGSGSPCVLFGSDDEYKQPKAVFRLADPARYKAGKTGPATVYIEGTLDGPVKIENAGWSAPWASLTPQFTFPAGYAVLVTGCRIISISKD